MESTTHPRSKILESYQLTIENCFQKNSPQIKLINYGTGSGKTHMLFEAICNTINTYKNTHIIGIYIAPMREHLKIPDEIREDEKYKDIPMYTINSLDMKMTDENLKSYKELLSVIIKDKNVWDNKSKEYSSDEVNEIKKKTEVAKKVISQIEYIRPLSLGDNEVYKKLLERAKQELDDLIEGFLEFLVRNKRDEKSWSKECVSLLEKFFPLHLLKDKSGIVLLTYKKFETKLPYFKFNGKTWIKQNEFLEDYIKLKQNEIKFVAALDEQEDGYKIMLESIIDVITPQELAINNALSSISREFSSLFMSTTEEVKDLLSLIKKNPTILDEFEEHIEKGKVINQDLQKLSDVYQNIIYKEGNSRNFLAQLVKINEGIENAINEVVKVFNEHNDGEPINLNFEMLSRTFKQFENNRSLLIPHEIYNALKDDLANIFAYNNLYIYNIEPLRDLFLNRSTGGHVLVTKNNNQKSVSLAELIYAILAIRLQIKSIQNFLVNVLEARDSQSHSIDIWSDQISRTQKVNKGETLQTEKFNKFLNRHYVYESYKSIINIMEIDRYQNPSNNLVNSDLREVSIGSTAILASLEQKIISMANPNNIVFLISATGGITGDLSTSYDMQYLEDSLRNVQGESSFSSMTEDEILLCERIRDYRKQNRNISISFFNENPASFPNSATREVVDRFHKLSLESFLSSIKNEVGWFSSYKKQELRRFIYFLFYLLEDNEINSMIAFTQTLKWIKRLVKYCEKSGNREMIFKSSEEHPDIYYFKINHKKYQNKEKQIKIVFYDSSFNSRYYDKSTKNVYQNELNEKANEKIFFISAYESASKGLNPIINSNNETKDFDSLTLLMDSFYSVAKPPVKKSKESSFSEPRYHLSLMKSIVKIGDLNVEIKDFNKYLNTPESEEFRRQQHNILLGKGILQSVGRIERRDSPNQVIKIFINDETQKNLIYFYKYLSQIEPDEIRKLSVNNHAVYLKVQEEEKKQSLQDYDTHVLNEIEAHKFIQTHREKMLDEIEKFHEDNKLDAITKTWNALRDILVFKNPKSFLDSLKETGSFPTDFVDSLFFYNQKPDEFVPHVKTIEGEMGERIRIISDSLHGEGLYTYLTRLYPENFKSNAKIGSDTDDSDLLISDISTNQIYKLYNEIIPNPEIFKAYIPRPVFFYDVLYPSLAENFVEKWIQRSIFSAKDWKAIKSEYGFEPIKDFPKYNKLYEKFDLYYMRNKELYCIDVKAWGKESGNRLSKKTLEKAEKKINLIESEYPEFKTVKGLLLNLHAEKERNHRHSAKLYSGNLIFFDDYYFPVASKILQRFLFNKDQ